jgi:RNA polymerase sigma-70 factor (ECF subfamily)
MATDEERWVQQARQGDRAAFRRLVEAHARPLFALCSRITREAAMAEDAVQEALLNAYRHLADFDGRSSFKTWLHRIAVNAALEQIRRLGKFDYVDNGAEAENDFLERCMDETPSPRQHAQGEEIRRNIDRELEHMTALERSAFLLRHVEGHSIDDISQALSLNISACKQAIFRAVRKLRGALQPLR